MKIVISILVVTVVVQYYLLLQTVPTDSLYKACSARVMYLEQTLNFNNIPFVR